MQREVIYVIGYKYYRDGVMFDTTNYHVARRRSTSGLISTVYGIKLEEIEDE